MYPLFKSFLPHQRLIHSAGSFVDYQLSLLLKKPIVRHFPVSLMIETTNLCNLKCPLCPTGSDTLSRGKGIMDYALFQYIIDQIQHRTGMLMLWNQGEPFLNPFFNEMVSYASSKKLYTMTSTNGSLPIDAIKIVKSGLSRLIFSLDGASKESYDKYRVGGDYELVLDNIRELVRVKAKLKSKTPFIVWQFIIFSHNEHEIGKAKALAKELKVDKIEFKTAQAYSADDLKYLPKNHHYKRYLNSDKEVVLKTKILNRCRRLFTQPVINWDGEFAICCYDKDTIFKIGNIKEENFSELWFSSKLQAIRQKVLRNRKEIDICNNCGEGIVQKLKPKD